MADIELKKDGASYKDDKVKYLKAIYAESLERNDTLRPINEENRLFYEGIDRELQERANDPNVERSSIFVHQLKPAIDTRKAETMTALKEREYPITLRPRNKNADEKERKQIAWVEQTINEQLRECGYLNDVFEEHIQGSEIYRSPSTVKVSWEKVYDKKPEIKVNEETGETEVIWVNTYSGGKPYVEWLKPDEFLYQPQVSIFGKSDYAIHTNWLEWHELMVLAEELELDKDKIAEFEGELEDYLAREGEGNSNETIADVVESERGTPFEDGYRDGKVLLAETYIVDYSDTGEKIVDQIFFLGNKHIVKKTKDYYKGFNYPFVTLTADRLPGTIEGLSAVDLGKMVQRLYNEIFNMYIDGVSYRLFSPQLVQAGTVFTNEPKMGLGRIWELSDIDGIRPLIQAPGDLPNLPALMEAIASLLRDNLNAQDISQGFQAQEYEKATSTRLRAAGANRRGMPLRERHGNAMIEVVKKVLALNQQFHENAENFVVDVIIDVPSLTNISDPEQDKQDAIMLVSQAMNLPQIYSTPAGKLKLRNLVQNMYEKFLKVGYDRYIPTEDEYRKEVLTIAKMEQATMAKQAVAESAGAGNQGVQ